MQTVKDIIIINLVFFAFIFCDAQEIEGTYKLIDQSKIASDIGVTYKFLPNGTFNNITHEHLDEKKISGGNYFIKNDTLFLIYKNLKSSNFSNSILIKKKKLNYQDRLFSSIQVFDSKGSPQPGVNLVLQTKEKKNIMAFTSNELGKFTPLSIFDCYVANFSVSFIGYEEVSISTDTLFGNDTEIKINLKNSSETFSNHDETHIFKITNFNYEGVELLSLKDQKEKIKLKKID